MWKRKLFVLFLVASVFMATCSVNSEKKIQTESPKFTINDVVDSTVYIDDFSDFLIYEDVPDVESYQDNSTIEFHFEHNIGYNEQESYVLPLDLYGNCTYFDISMKFNYTISISNNDMSRFRLYTGSYYDKDGNFIGIDYSNNEHYVNYAGIVDAWASTKGKFRVGAYPIDTHEFVETVDESLPFIGYITERLVRNTSGIFSELYNTSTGELLLGHSWALNKLYKPVNYLLMIFQYGPYISSADIYTYDLSANLTFGNFVGDLGPPSISFISPENGDVINTSEIPVTWEGYDDTGIIYYLIRSDTEPWINKSTATIHSFKDFSQGNHTISLLAADSVGNTVTISTVIYVDRTISFFLGYDFLLASSTVTMIICQLVIFRRKKKL